MKNFQKRNPNEFLWRLLPKVERRTNINSTHFSPQKIEEEYFIIYFKNLVLPWYKKKKKKQTKTVQKGKTFFHEYREENFTKKIQQYLKRVIYHHKMGFIPGIQVFFNI